MKKKDLIIAITACPVGIAHTYMAAETLKKAAEDLGVDIRVETDGSIGVKDELTADEITQATAVIIAADKAVDLGRFQGKRIIQTSVKEGIKNAPQLIQDALDGKGHLQSATVNQSQGSFKKERTGVYKHLMNGVSHMIPLVVCGGVLIALAIALSGITEGKGADVTNPYLKQMLDLGVLAFGLMVPILAGYIAYSIADRPGLAPGLIGGALSNAIGAGFLGGIIAGFLAGYVARYIKSWKVPDSISAIMPIFVIPLLTTLVVGIVMYIIGYPIKDFMDLLTHSLEAMQNSGSAVLLAIILGMMIAFDMGGPVNKVAFLFGTAMITQGVYSVMGPISVAICIPPIGLGLASLMSPKKYAPEEKEAGKAAILMGSIGITEGAIPFAAADPIRVIPSIMIGSATGAAIAAIGKVASHAPHGGPIVLPVVDHRIMFVIAVLVGSFLTAFLVNGLKKEQ